MHDIAAETSSTDVRFDHTIIPAHDKRVSAEFFSEIFGLPAPVQAGYFLQVRLSDGRISTSRSPGSTSLANTSRSS